MLRVLWQQLIRQAGGLFLAGLDPVIFWNWRRGEPGDGVAGREFWL